MPWCTLQVSRCCPVTLPTVSVAAAAPRNACPTRGPVSRPGLPQARILGTVIPLLAAWSAAGRTGSAIASWRAGGEVSWSPRIDPKGAVGCPTPTAGPSSTCSIARVPPPVLRALSRRHQAPVQGAGVAEGTSLGDGVCLGCGVLRFAWGHRARRRCQQGRWLPIRRCGGVGARDPAGGRLRRAGREPALWRGAVQPEGRRSEALHALPLRPRRAGGARIAVHELDHAWRRRSRHRALRPGERGCLLAAPLERLSAQRSPPCARAAPGRSGSGTPAPCYGCKRRDRALDAGFLEAFAPLCPECPASAPQREELEGPVNACAPNPCTSAEFASAFGGALGRPALIPLPTPVVKGVFGEMGDETLLVSQRAVPTALLASGFRFWHNDIRTALKSAVSYHSATEPATHG